MASKSFDKMFMDVWTAVQESTPEADHEEILDGVIRFLVDKNYNLNPLYGHDYDVDEALDAVLERSGEDDDEEGDEIDW